MAVKTLREWLEKATPTWPFQTGDLTGGTKGGYLSPQQAREFIRLAVEESVILEDVRVETSDAVKFEVSRINLGSRILRPGLEGDRVAEADRVKPTTGKMELDTQLFKGEIGLTDEQLEDNIEKGQLADTLMAIIIKGVSRDMEDLAIKSDKDRDPTGTDVADTESAIFDKFNGIIADAQDVFPAAQQVSAAGYTQMEDVWASLVEAMPPRYRRDYDSLKIYTSVKAADLYHKQLSERGTVMGDQYLISRKNLEYRGIPIVQVPLMSGTSTVNGTAIDYSKFALLIDPKNIVLGFHRKIRIEQFRDPRDGITSFLPSVRFDVKYANPEYGVIGSAINV